MSGQNGEGASPTSPLMGEWEEVLFDEPGGKDAFALWPEMERCRIRPSPSLSSSSPFHFNTVVDYTWETVYYPGRQIVTHVSSRFIAYVVKVNTVGAVRVIDGDSKERVLMKGDRGLIKDVDFLHRNDDVLVGFIDEFGTVYIHKIVKELKSGKLAAPPVLKVTLDCNPLRSDFRRFHWCKHIPDEANASHVATPKDPAYHFAIIQNDIVYASNMMLLVNSKGEGAHPFEEICDQFLKIDVHSGPVTDLSFAPDGTALATCSRDGTVKFFQIYFRDQAPARCLYSWSPHEGKPIERFVFLDNHQLGGEPGGTQYWKYVVTASDSCGELRLYTCKSWDCLQTIRFMGAKGGGGQWKLEVDITGRYIMATDINQRSIFLIHLECREESARFEWIQEFAMPWITIGFNVTNAEQIKFEDAVDRGYSASILGDRDSYTKDDLLHLIEINVIHPKSMQTGSVALLTPTFQSRSQRRISFNRSVDLREFEDDRKPEEELEMNLKMKVSRTSVSPNVSAAEMSEQLSNLIGISPSASTSKGRRSPSPTTRVPYLGTNGGSKTSNSSSPSREVEEILSPKIGGSCSGIGIDDIPPQAPLVMKAQVNLDNGNYLSHSEIILEKLGSLTDLVSSQAKEIKELKTQISRMSTAGQVGDILERHATQSRTQFNRMEELLRIQSQAPPAAVFPPNLAEVLAGSIATVVKKEVESLVPRTLNELFEPSRLNINVQIDRLGGQLETKLGQHINQIMQQDRVWQTLTNSFQTITKTVFDSAFNELFLTSVFPRCQSAVQEMLTQVSDTFKEGTREYLGGLERTLDRERKREDLQQFVTAQMQSIQDALSSSLQVEIETQMLHVLGGIQSSVVRHMEDVLSKKFQEQQRVLEISVVNAQRTLTPAVSVCESLGGFSPSDPKLNKRKVMEMVREGNLKGAFTLASTGLGDSEALLQLCKMHSPAVLPDLGLNSAALLSLMQMLASDIRDDTDLKIDYLSMSIMCLDLSEPKNVKGVTRLVPVLQAAVGKFEEANPDSPLMSRIKVLQMSFNRAQQKLV